MFVRVGEPDKQRPPVVNQGHHARHDPAAREVLGGEPAPAPLILQFVEIVLGVGPVAIEMGERAVLGQERLHLVEQLQSRPEITRLAWEGGIRMDEQGWVVRVTDQVTLSQGQIIHNVSLTKGHIRAILSP